MRSQTFQRAALTQAAKDMRLAGFTPHMLRHTAVPWSSSAVATLMISC